MALPLQSDLANAFLTAQTISTPIRNPVTTTAMAGWYRVVKTIKGHRYLYEQQTFREGGRVRTRNRYLGPAGGEGGHAGSSRPTQPDNTSTPLFTDPSDFARALGTQFDAPQWGKDAGEQLLGSAVSGVTTTGRRSSQNLRPSARFNFNTPVAYDPPAKRRFHLRARRQLRELADVLGLHSSDYDLRSNQGGVAVSGEVTLHSDHLYVQVNQSVIGDMGILFRSCKNRQDYSGGANNFAPLDMLNDPDELARRIIRGGIYNPGRTPVTTTPRLSIHTNTTDDAKGTITAPRPVTTSAEQQIPVKPALKIDASSNAEFNQDVHRLVDTASRNDPHRRYFTDRTLCINTPSDAVAVFRELLQEEDTIDQDKEHYYVMHLDTRNFVKMVEVVFVGTLNASIVHPRETFRRAIAEGSHGIIIAHNHPSGLVDPSIADIGVTKTMFDAGETIGIQVKDHIVFSAAKAFSFRENKEIDLGVTTTKII